MKLLNEKMSAYSVVSLTSLFLCLYCLLLPLISPLMDQLCPDLWQCAYLNVTGRPCPLCGVTRDFDDLLSGSFTALKRNKNEYCSVSYADS